MDASPGPRENWDAPDIWLYPEGEAPRQDYRGPTGYQPDPSAPSSGSPDYGQPSSGSPSYGQPNYGSPNYGQPNYGSPNYGQPRYSPPNYGAPSDAEPNYPPPNYPSPDRGQRGHDPSEPRRSRKAWWLAAAACVVLVLVVALVNAARGNNRKADAGPNLTAPTAGVPLPGGSAQPGPSSSAGSGNSGGQGGSGQSPVPAVSCPVIRDEESHLQYNCVDSYLTQSAPDSLLGLRIALSHEVEPGWLISEGSGNPKSVVTPPDDTTVAFRAGPTPLPAATPAPTALPSAGDVQTEAKRRIASALARGAYGDNPVSSTFAAHARSFGGVTGYEIVTYITLDPAFRAKEKLADKTERLWTVGVPTAAGVSIFMMSIPDARSDLWPRAEATVGTIKVI